MVIGVYLATFLASVSILITLLIRHERTTNIILLFNILTTVQSFGRLLVATTYDVELAWLGNMFIYVGGCFCPLVILLILIKLCKINMPKIILYPIVGYTFLVYALSLTIGSSDIYYTNLEIAKGNGFTYLVKEYGPTHILFPIMIVIYCVIILLTLVYAIRKYRKVSIRSIKPIVFLAVIILVAYIMEKIFKSNVSFVSLGYFIAMLFAVHFLQHVNMLDMQTNIAKCIEKRMENGYIQFDEKKRCAGYTDKILELFPEVEIKWNVDEKIPEDDSFLYKEIIQWFLNHKKGNKKTIEVGHHFYEMTIYEIPYNKKKCVGYILELYDRTAENKYLETVEKYNSNLKKEVFEQEKEIDQINTVFGKVVDPAVREHLLKGHLMLGGETKDITVMFCDIRSFTAMSEDLEPEQVVKMLNFYFTALGKCITKNHGIVNKYIGDAIMAVFGAPETSENHPLDAYNAAMDMRKALVRVNKKFAEKGWPELHFGIGIHSGKALAGNIGATNRMEYTVIGDTVNTASRIESLCKVYETDLLITESTAQRLYAMDGATGNASAGAMGRKLTFVDEAKIRGKDQLVKLYK